MAKIFLYIFFFILILNKFIQAVPLTAGGNEDIMVASSRLHREPDPFRHGVNSIPNVMNFPSDDFASHFRRNSNYAMPRQEEEPETVFIDMKIDSDEEQEPETQYVNLFIDTK